MGGNDLIRINNLTKVFQKEKIKVKALIDLNLIVKKSEFICILGPTGCGKTTLLKIIAGLETPTEGEILLNNQKITTSGSDRGLVFQEFALFPWRTTKKNIEFGLEIRGIPLIERNKIVQHYIKLIGLEGFENVFPRQLSSGMKQRVAIARALVNDPDVLLMDEPFGALDAQTRNIMQKELLRIWEETKITIIFVTHSVDEAVYLSDRIVILTSRPGTVKKIVEVDLPRPRDRTSKEFYDIRHLLLQDLEFEVEKMYANQIK